MTTLEDLDMDVWEVYEDIRIARPGSVSIRDLPRGRRECVQELEDIGLVWRKGNGKLKLLRNLDYNHVGPIQISGPRIIGSLMGTGNPTLEVFSGAVWAISYEHDGQWLLSFGTEKVVLGVDADGVETTTIQGGGLFRLASPTLKTHEATYSEATGIVSIDRGMDPLYAGKKLKIQMWHY